MHAMLTGINGMKGLREIEGVTVYLDYEDLTKRDFILAIGLITWISPMPLGNMRGVM